MINKKTHLHMTLGSVLALVLFFAATAHAANPFCQREIEGISVANDSVAEIEAALKDMGLQDITCKQRSKSPCEVRRKQMRTYANNERGFINNLGDKKAHLSFGPDGTPRSLSIVYYSEAPDSYEANDENRNWDGWTYQDLIESRIAEFCNTDTPENAHKRCNFRRGIDISIHPYSDNPRNKDCNYTFEARFNTGGNIKNPSNTILESMQIIGK